MCRFSPKTSFYNTLYNNPTCGTAEKVSVMIDSRQPVKVKSPVYGDFLFIPSAKPARHSMAIHG